MNILILNYEFPPVGGGASTASCNLAKQFVKNNNKVDVLTCRISGQPVVENLEGVTVYRVASIRKGPHDASLFGAFSYLVTAYFKLRKLTSLTKYDYAIFFFAVPTGILSFYWRKKTKSPYVICLRGSDVPGYDRDAKLINFIHNRIMPITRRILKNSYKVIANSSSLRSLALDSFPETSISVVTNGIAHKEFKPDGNKNSSDSTVNALCVSRLVKRKGINFLLRALKHNESTNLKVWIAGSGPDEKNLYQLADQLGVLNQVEFLGQQSAEQLAKLYSKADFLIHTALTESFSMTLLEAMSSGLPIIASNVGGIPELVEDDVNGILFPVGDVAALSSAVNVMCMDEGKRCKYSENNRAKIINSFTWEHICAQYLEHCCIVPGNDTNFK